MFDLNTSQCIFVMNLFVSLPDKEFDTSNFIFVHPNEKIQLSTQCDGIYTLIFTKGKLSICFDDILQSERRIFRMFDVIILHLVCRFLQVHSDSETFLKMTHDIINRVDLQLLTVDANMFMQDLDLRQKYFSMAFHFQHRYGVLENICLNFGKYPPHESHCFLPMLAMADYEHRPLVFQNNSVSYPTAFRVYDFEKFSTIISPSPIYEDGVNIIVRNYHTGVCKLYFSFEYKEAQRAKLSRSERNDINKYTFLIQLNNRYYQVLAIYTKGMVSKYLPCLVPRKSKICLNGCEIIKVFKRLNEQTQTSPNIQRLIQHQIIDEKASFQKEIKLTQWLKVVISQYVDRLEIYESIPETPELAFQNMTHDTMVVYVDETGVQMYYKTEQASLIYTQIYEFSLPAFQVCFDEIAQNETDTYKFVKFASFLRGILTQSINQRQQPHVNLDNLDIHGYLIFLETVEAKALLDLNELEETAFIG